MKKVSVFEAARDLLGPIAAEYGEVDNISSECFPVPVAALKNLERAYQQEFDRRERAQENREKREDLFRRSIRPKEAAA